MGIVGRYIDQESDSNKDIIIEAMNWTKRWVSDNDSSCHCLIGHINNVQLQLDGYCTNEPEIYSVQWLVGVKVFRMFEQFGTDRIVSMFKARAAKDNKVINVETDIHELEKIDDLELSSSATLI